MNAHIDMVIAAKTGQGKTLTFGIPVLDLLIKKLQKDEANAGEAEEFKSLKALVMSPTRELAIQIKDHLQAIVPVQYQDKIKLCPLVGGMSVQKQERLLSYNPTIIIATPGRLWELLNDRMNPYLQSELPMIDVLVLDEADRMIEDGHFKEMKLILDYVYSKRVEFKKLKLLKAQNKKKGEDDEDYNAKTELKKSILDRAKSSDSKFVLKTVEKSRHIGKIDLSNIVDLYDEEQMLEEIDPSELVIEETSKNKRMQQQRIKAKDNQSTEEDEEDSQAEDEEEGMEDDEDEEEQKPKSKADKKMTKKKWQS